MARRKGHFKKVKLFVPPAMSLKHIPLVLELLGFLSDGQPQVRRIALARLLYVIEPGPFACLQRQALHRSR